MATTRTQIAASPDEVFAALANPENYGDWVVGSDTVRDADPTWPKFGSRFHHRIGFGPLKVNDHTEVLEVEAPHRLVMRARARPLGSAKVTLLLTERGGGTYVTMIEVAGDRREHGFQLPPASLSPALAETRTGTAEGRILRPGVCCPCGRRPGRLARNPVRTKTRRRRRARRHRIGGLQLWRADPDVTRCMTVAHRRCAVRAV